MDSRRNDAGRGDYPVLKLNQPFSRQHHIVQESHMHSKFIEVAYKGYETQGCELLG